MNVAFANLKYTSSTDKIVLEPTLRGYCLNYYIKVLIWALEIRLGDGEICPLMVRFFLAG